ncbi:DNA-binding response regulator [Paraflavitalea soli]|uniref:DNA-binding response regulator n=1 Tax=Paraflavitalea soli TaxID=2315862 RepID=A0A3B7MKI0_9BACT|nr:LytTR family DNA-binding domain-containing protein [Paraflavitalea soli]AXY74964.1 DNA-binding response regulator [Paraflavitalea soli]
MKVVIIEDEEIATRHLKTMLKEIDPDIEIVAALDSIESSIHFFSKASLLDLVLVDIELGDGQSFDIFTKVNVEAPIIFTTAYQEHVLKAFKLNSIDYLLKPVNKEELTSAILKYKKIHARPKQPFHEYDLSSISKGKAEAREGIFKTRYLAKNGTRLISIAQQDIAYFYTKDRLQYIKTKGNDDYVIDKRLDEIETEIDAQVFFRANRQFIINYENIEKVHTWFSGKLKVQVKPLSYEEIIVGRLKANDFKKWLGD